MSDFSIGDRVMVTGTIYDVDYGCEKFPYAIKFDYDPEDYHWLGGEAPLPLA